tara:strand:- start:372 stop:563 length:192 start_codon:yes stop_codon:yes gene_type:complete
MMTERRSIEQSVRDIRHRIRKKYSAEEKIPVVLEGLRAESMLASSESVTVTVPSSTVTALPAM